MLRSEVSWEFLSERPSKYFLNLKKKIAARKAVHKLQHDDGTVTSDLK